MNVFYIAWLTFHEARRRRLLLVGALLGVAFLVLYAIGYYALRQDFLGHNNPSAIMVNAMGSVFTLMGLYAVNFLVGMISVLVSVDTISGEIASHSIQSIVTKPLRRWEVLLGKWVGFAVMITIAVLALAGGVILIAWLIGGTLPQHLPAGLGVMVLEGWILLALTLLGGTIFSTLTNGVVVFMLFGLAFVGGWTEQIGALLSNDTAVNIGIISSLLMPTEALWRRAVFEMQPSSVGSFMMGPFAAVSAPSVAMVLYAILYGGVALALAVRTFQKRDL